MKGLQSDKTASRSTRHNVHCLSLSTLPYPGPLRTPNSPHSTATIQEHELCFVATASTQVCQITLMLAGGRVEALDRRSQVNELQPSYSVALAPHACMIRSSPQPKSKPMVWDTPADLQRISLRHGPDAAAASARPLPRGQPNVSAFVYLLLAARPRFSENHVYMCCSDTQEANNGLEQSPEQVALTPAHSAFRRASHAQRLQKPLPQTK